MVMMIIQWSIYINMISFVLFASIFTAVMASILQISFHDVRAAYAVLIFFPIWLIFVHNKIQQERKKNKLEDDLL